MKRIPLEKAKPGLILAQKLERDDGVLLAKKGVEVTEGLIRMLTRMNVDFISIETEDELSPEDRAALLALEEEKLELRFARVSGDPILTALKLAIAARLRREYQEPDEEPPPEKPAA